MSDAKEPAPYEDEPDAIPDEAVLFRRVAPDFIAWEQVDEHGVPAFRSGAFQDYPEERARELGYPGPAMSVHLADILEQLGKSPEEFLAPHGPEFGLVCFPAGTLRAHDMGVQRRATDDDPSHAVVFATTRGKRNRAQQKRTRESAQWVVPPQARRV